MRIAYLDCASGISGDMTLAALIDAGVALETVQEGIDSLGLPTCKLEVEEVKRKGFRALKLHVRHEPEHAHRHLTDIVAMIDGSSLSEPQKELAKSMFTRLGAAEAKAHGTSIEKVHFHEVGAVDSIADLVGCAMAFDLLAVDQVVCSPVPTGHGTIQIAHGLTSVPAPATAELLKGVPLAASAIEAELTTPTGATIAATVASSFGQLPAMKIQDIGYGAGTHDFSERANVLRLIVGSSADVVGAVETDEVWILETNLDDATGEVIGHAQTRLFEAGALDVYATPIQMKKNRPATKLTVLCREEAVTRLESILFAETTTIGVRRWQTVRSKLAREACTVQTPWGKVPAKRVTLPDGSMRLTPEYDACETLARRAKVPLQDLIAHVRRSDP